ncbi:hypothetical protein [Nonomuraea sp. B19D2]|uniref:hypothetical protein n=1 Tax=Nonomuraea sp. B19D2 TaxID=3159561 RepID=UPI0032DAC49D
MVDRISDLVSRNHGRVDVHRLRLASLDNDVDVITGMLVNCGLLARRQLQQPETNSIALIQKLGSDLFDIAPHDSSGKVIILLSYRLDLIDHTLPEQHGIDFAKEKPGPWRCSTRGFQETPGAAACSSVAGHRVGTPGLSVITAGASMQTRRQY